MGNNKEINKMKVKRHPRHTKHTKDKELRMTKTIDERRLNMQQYEITEERSNYTKKNNSYKSDNPITKAFQGALGIVVASLLGLLYPFYLFKFVKQFFSIYLEDIQLISESGGISIGPLIITLFYIITIVLSSLKLINKTRFKLFGKYLLIIGSFMMYIVYFLATFFIEF